MKRDLQPGGPVLVPGVVSLAASSRRTLRHGDSFAMFDEYGDVVAVEPGGDDIVIYAIVLGII